MTTLWTTSTGIPRWNMLQQNTFGSSLVGYKKLQHGIGPAIVPCPLLMMLLFVIPAVVAFESSQVFHDDGFCSNTICKSNQLLTRNMQHVLRYGLFSSTKPLKKTFSGTSSNAGYFGLGLSDAKPAMIKRSSFDIESFVCFRINGTKDILLASVYSNDASFGFGVWNFNLDGQTQVPILADEFEFGVGPSTFWQGYGLVGDETFPDSQTLVADVEVTFPTNWYDEFGVFSEAPFFVGPHRTIGRDDMAKERAGNLGRQLELFSDGGVEFFGKMVRAWRMITSFEDDLREPVASISVVNRDIIEPVGSGDNLEFVGSQTLHIISLYRRLYDSFEEMGNNLRKEDAGNSSHPLKTGGFSCQNCG